MTTVRFIIDEDLKERAESILSEMGLDIPTYLRMALNALVQEKRIPFGMQFANIPNQVSICAMEELKTKSGKGAYRDLTPDELFNELQEKR